ncbi:sarcosine oxidase subunit alpha [Cocleimonas flava]|uniref:Sarcosine oxidase subunit alpha n=1 Tax=Cocleimonas flava TaxID=634765 RepID=A0A4V2P8B3_9GAMM|nr:sarcosine oxidase subunit alpha family protein [Cocleimonas flava]TCJ85055.1 sarcosine oxidase subunit alpha [Cocleimonas flava]
MSQKNRLNKDKSSGFIDRDKTIHFNFNGEQFEGYQGDTLASALLANNQKLVARSFKYHRPRGIFTAGSEEPNALMHLRTGAYQEPNVRATVAELFEGLEARSQNHRGSLKHDLMAINDFLSPFLTAGFYYKTFMWPKAFWEKLYEPIIRQSAGLGELSGQEDPDKYDKGFLHCDILIIGAGPSGLAAALAAGQAGSRVILADEDFVMGGRLNNETYQVNGMHGAEWAKTTLAELASMDNVRLMKRTTVLGAYDHGIYSALERKTDHLASTDPVYKTKPRQVLWKIYSKRAILSAGSTERPIAFPNNDRPGIMQAGAVRTYANRYDVAAGQNVSIFTNNDDGWRTAQDLAAKGINIQAVIDSRDIQPVAEISGANIEMGAQVIDTQGRHALQSIQLSNGKTYDTDCLAVSGGWNPNVQLSCHHRGRPQWNKDILAFVPSGDGSGGLPPEMHIAGAANGDLDLSSALSSGHELAKSLSKELGNASKVGGCPKAESESIANSAFWFVKTDTKSRSWLDFQNDVTTKDIRLAQQEGFTAVEHVKRYTTLGMATDQGKTSNIPAMAVMADNEGKTIPEVGTTIFRPPYTPVSIAAYAGRSRGKEFRPTRLTPSHRWAKEQGAEFVEVGAWMRAQWFPKDGETHWRESVDREVTQTRNSVGICDVSTLGKIDIQGRDAGEFLNRVYCNTFSTLKVGMVRYGLMLREDGFAMDDGTTARLGEHHYLMTTTTANAVGVSRHLEFCRQCLWPDLDVHVISATEQYAQYSVAGPNARKLLQKIVDPEFDISNEAFPFMACGDITVCGGTAARLFRISFSGELAYEIAVPTRYGYSMMKTLMQAGEEFDAVIYGTEALSVMRIEKGHAAGNELTGQTTAHNLGMGRMVSKKKDSIGNMMSERPNLIKEDANRLVGFVPVDKSEKLSAGAHFIQKGKSAITENDEGWMSSVAFSPSLGHSIGIGFIKSGHQRMGEIVTASNPLLGKDVDVEIVSAHFVDPDGERLRV